MVLLSQDIFKITMAKSTELATSQPTGGRQTDFPKMQQLDTISPEHIVQIDLKSLGRRRIELAGLFEAANPLKLACG
jgi:hypothetical protein